MRALRTALLALALAAPGTAAAQSDDRGFLTRFLEDNLSAAGRTVTIEGFAGALSSRATMARLTVADDDGVWLTLNGVALAWNRGALLGGRIEIEELSAAEILLDRPPRGGEPARLPAPEASGFTLPELPVSVAIGRLRAGRVALGPAVLGQAVELALDGALTLAGGEGQARLEAARTDGAEGRLALDGSFSNVSRVLRLALDLAEGPGGIAATLLGVPGAPALGLAVTGEGPLDDFAATLALATDGRERVAGRLRLLGGETDAAGGRETRFRAELGGEVAALLAPDYAAFFGPDTRLEAEGRRRADGGLDLPVVRIATEALRLAGGLRLAPGGLPEFFALDGEIAAAGGGPVRLPLPGAPTEVTRVGLTLGFDAAMGEDWRLEAEVLGLSRPDLAAETLRLDGAGRILREDGLARVLADIAFAADGLNPADPALARAVGGLVRGRAVADWRADRPLVLPDLRLDGAGYGLTAALVLGGEPFAADGRGLLRFDDLARFSDLAGRPLGGTGAVAFQGRFEPASGATDALLAVAGENLSLGVAELDRLLAGSARVALDLTRDATGTTIRSAEIDARGLTGRASGTIRSGGSDLAADLVFADLGVLGPGYGGAVEAALRVRRAGEGAETVRLAATGRDVRLGVAELDGLLRGDSRILLEGRRIGDAFEIDVARVTARALTLAATGRLERGASALEAELDFADLGVLGGPWRGALAARATLAEEGPAQRLALSGTGRGLAAGIDPLDRLLAGESRLTLELRREGEVIDLGWVALEAATLSARATGRLAAGASDIAADIAFADLARLGPRFGGALSGTARLVETGARRALTLAGSARSLRLGQPEADTLLRGETRIALEAEEQGGIVRIRRLALANPQLTAEAEGDHSGAAGRVGLNLRLADLGLIVPAFPGPLTLGGEITDGPGGYGVALAAEGPGGISARVSGSLAPDLATADLALAGTAELALLNRLLLPRSVQGPVRFDLALRGPPGLSALTGTVRAEGARIVDPTYRVTLANARLAATLGGGRAVLDAAAEVEGGGRVTLSGPLDLAAPYAADLAARLERARLTDPQLYDTRVTGTLAVSGPLLGGGRIGGSLALDATELRIPATGLGGLAPIPELRHIAEPAEVRATRARAGLLDEAGAEAPPARPFDLALAISAPRRIFVRGRGLDAELGGALELRGTTADVQPVGGFSLIRGRLDLLGRRFVLTEGQVQLQGAFVPYLRLAAVTEAEGVSVRIEVEGEATEPAIRFLSSPELPEEEVLARLLFGKGIENISALQAAQLASAVATLAGRGGEGVVGRLRRGFGLDDLDVQTGADGTAAVRAGRYLSENVYADVTVGADGRSAVSLNIDVTPVIRLRGTATSDGRTGIGLFFERDY